MCGIQGERTRQREREITMSIMNVWEKLTLEVKCDLESEEEIRTHKVKNKSWKTRAEKNGNDTF